MRTWLGRKLAVPAVVAVLVMGCGPARSGPATEPPMPVDDAGSLPADAGVPLAVRFVIHERDGGVTAVSSLTYSLPFSIRVDGAPPMGTVTLITRVQRLTASAVFRASAQGVVDTATDAPVRGSYAGVDPDGLLWSMGPAASAFSNDFDVGVEADVEGGELVSARLARPGMGTGTTRSAVTAGALPGLFFAFPSSERRPAVLVLGGSECSLDRTAFTSAWLTTAGYHALAVDYCQQGIIRRVPLESLVGALDWLARQPGVDGARLAVMGGSRGGELALQLGAIEPRLSAVIAVVPSPWRWSDTDDGTTTAWTLGGMDLPVMPDAPNAMGTVEALPGGGSGLRLTPVFEAALAAATPAQKTAAAIDIARTSASILMVGGRDDGVWPSCRFIDDAWTSLSAANHQATHPLDRRECFEGAGHSLGPPGWSSMTGYAFFDPALGTSLILGGTPQGRGRASRAFDDAWREFLGRAFGR